MKKEIKSGMIMAVSFLLTIGLAGITYAAFVSITEVNTTGTLTADLMNNVINNQKDLDTRIAGGGTPSGFVGAFYLSSCPTGWSEANGSEHVLDLRGTFVRGMNGNANSRDVARVLGSYQADIFGTHLHSVNPPNTSTTSGGAHTHQWAADSGVGGIWGQGDDQDGGSGTNRRSTRSAGGHAHTVDIGAFNSASSGGTETRPKNVALLYCVKD